MSIFLFESKEFKSVFYQENHKCFVFGTVSSGFSADDGQLETLGRKSKSGYSRFVQFRLAARPRSFNQPPGPVTLGINAHPHPPPPPRMLIVWFFLLQT